MNFGENALVTGMEVFFADFQKRGRVFVPGRGFHSITCRYSGRISVETDGVSLLSEPGTLTYIPAGQGYETEVLEAGKMIAVHFTLADNQAIEAAVIPAGEELAAQFRGLLRQYHAGRGRAPGCMAAFYGILAAISDKNEEGVNAKPVILAARDYLERRFFDPGLSIAELAALLGISDSYLRREFRAVFGIGPAAFLKHLRIEHAKTLLSTGYYSVSTVAGLCGFSSHSYFSAEFHRLTGMAPGEFKK